MGKLRGYVGQRFGKLTVIEVMASVKGQRKIRRCLCDCGNVCIKDDKGLFRRLNPSCNECIITEKICTGCKKMKPISEYNKNSDCKMGIQVQCKECNAAFYIENRERIKEQYNENMKNEKLRENRRSINYKSWQKNKHKELAYKRIYEKRPEVIERRKRIHLERKATDIQYNIRRRLRGRLRDTVKRTIGVGYKYKSSLVLLGCDMDFFKSYIESKFEYGMNWDRFTYIHIDHIKPCSQFDLTKIEDQKICFHYSNLQPLWEVDNLVKSWKYFM